MRKQSKINHIHTSTGERLTRAEFDRRINEAKKKKIQEQLNEWGYNFCQLSIMHDLDSNDMEYNILDCSHIISVKKCIETGKAELAYDLSNIRVLCRHCHKIHDNLILKFKQHA